MGARIVAAGDEDGLGLGDGLECLGGTGHPADTGGIVCRSDDDKVIVHNILTAHAVSVGYELVLSGSSVDQENVGIAVLAQCQGLPGAYRHHFDADVVLLLKVWQDKGQQARVLGAGRGSENEPLWFGGCGWVSCLGH